MARGSREFNQDPGDGPVSQAYVHALAGEREQSRAILERIEAPPVAPWFIWQLARIHAELGDLDGCFRWLEIGVERHSVNLANFRLSPRLALVRQDSRFEALLEHMKLA
ncbi:MAG: hypothetical protein L3K10_00455 [Thermoplasmata archaeon]|nr:hypothetical protein [Thermoplasmata archaeon]